MIWLDSETEKLNFPQDHWWHSEKMIEWIYFFGRLENGKFFHYAEFLFGPNQVKRNMVHYSLDGEFFEEVDSFFEKRKCRGGYAGKQFFFNTPKLGITFIPISKPIIHKTNPGRNYYSIPRLEGEGFLYPDKKIKATGWFDHEFSEFQGLPNWEWLGINLRCGLDIMAFSSEGESLCDVTLDGTTFETDFIIDGHHLFLYEPGMYLTLNPIQDEKIFDPKVGIKYSEQPFEVISKGGVIGYGMREKTYHKKKEKE